MKTVIITGSTSGIGLGIAEAFALSGNNVVLNGLGKKDEIEATRARLAALGAGEVIFHGANMLKPDEIADLVKTAEAKFGRVDVIVPNAGIQHVEKIEDFPPEKWDAIIGINLSSAFHLIRAAMPGMKKNGFGRIIAIASAHGLVASPYKSAYVAAKHGILGLIKTVALEGAEFGITANAICPGYIATEMVMAVPEAVREKIIGMIPAGRLGEPEEIARCVTFLVSEDASFINGSTISANGAQFFV